MLTKDQAKRLIQEKWRAVPEKGRNSASALIFATRSAREFPFRCSGDPYQYVSAWIREISPDLKWE